MGRGAGAQLAAPRSGYCVGAAGSGYPPGNQLLIPGERFNATIVRYLEFARDCDCAKWKPRSKSLLARYNCPRSRGLPFASRPEQR